MCWRSRSTQHIADSQPGLTLHTAPTVYMQQLSLPFFSASTNKTQNHKLLEMSRCEIRSSRSLYEPPSIARSPPSRRPTTCQAQLTALLRSFFRSHSKQKPVDIRSPSNTEARVDQACVDQACVDQTRGELPGVTFHWRCCRGRRESKHTFVTSTHFTCMKIWSEYGYELVPSYHRIKCTQCEHRTCEQCIFLEIKLEGE